MDTAYKAVLRPQPPIQSPPTGPRLAERFVVGSVGDTRLPKAVLFQELGLATAKAGYES